MGNQQAFLWKLSVAMRIWQGLNTFPGIYHSLSCNLVALVLVVQVCNTALLQPVGTGLS